MGVPNGGEVEILVGKLAGFCNGVKNAVNVAEKQIEKGKVYCLGEIVHNKQVIEYLELKLLSKNTYINYRINS